MVFFSYFKILTVLFSRAKFKLKPSKGVTLRAARPQTLRQGLRPWTHSSRRYMVGVAQEAPRATLGTKYSKLSSTMKIGEIGQGKGRLLLIANSRQLLAAWRKLRLGRRLFPCPISPIFTGCKASGLAAFSRHARKRQKCTPVWLQPFASNSGNNACSTNQAISAIAGPGWSPTLVGVWGETPA